jgi:tRNA (cmo5U34)-methyltransferase
MAETKQRVDFDESPIPAEEYENLARKFIPAYDGLYKLAEILLAENLPAQAEILIVGAGGGKEISVFGRAFPDALMTGVDPSEKMLAVAQSKIERENLQSRVSLVRGTIADVDDRQFDAGCALLVMHFLPDDGGKLDFLRNIHRRLKQGAKFIIADGCFDKTAADFPRLMNAYKNHAEANGAPPEITAEAVKNITENVYAVPAEREIELLQAANFGEIQQFFQGLWFRAWTATRL